MGFRGFDVGFRVEVEALGCSLAVNLPGLLRLKQGGLCGLWRSGQVWGGFGA